MDDPLPGRILKTGISNPRLLKEKEGLRTDYYHHHHENDRSTEQNLSFVESNHVHAEPNTGQNHVHGGDSHELPAANQNDNILINVNENANSISALNAFSECSFKVEKPKLPKFSGNIREYAMFKSDFKHIVHSKYSKRDPITLLSTCLVGKPLQLIQGLGNDLEVAWAYLDSIYSDPRFLADAITSDISSVRPLREGDDKGFCDFVHLIKRSFNILKEVGHPNDMNNNHMLAIIEQKMCSSDRKVGARQIESEKKEATLENLMTWLTVEMKSRIELWPLSEVILLEQIKAVSVILQLQKIERAVSSSVGCVKVVHIGLISTTNLK